MTLADKAMLSANIVLTGFVVVFAVLILLIVLIMIYSTIVRKAENAGKNRAAKKAEKKTEFSGVTTATTASVKQTNGIPDEVVAVISAAVFSMYGSNNNVKIKSIKKSKGVRPIWASAGVFDNTRPF